MRQASWDYILLSYWNFYFCGHLCVQVCRLGTNIWRSDIVTNYFFLLLPLYELRQDNSVDMELQDPPPVLVSQCSDFPLAESHVGPGDPDSGPCAWAARTLPTKQSDSPLNIVKVHHLVDRRKGLFTHLICTQDCDPCY